MRALAESALVDEAAAPRQLALYLEPLLIPGSARIGIAGRGGRRPRLRGQAAPRTTNETAMYWSTAAAITRR
jgi:hypothetical protein